MRIVGGSYPAMSPPPPPPPPLYRTNEVIILGVLRLLLVLSAFLFTSGVANRYIAVNAYTFTWIDHGGTRGLKGGSKRGELNSARGVNHSCSFFILYNGRCCSASLRLNLWICSAVQLFQKNHNDAFFGFLCHLMCWLLFESQVHKCNLL